MWLLPEWWPKRLRRVSECPWYYVTLPVLLLCHVLRELDLWLWWAAWAVLLPCVVLCLRWEFRHMKLARISESLERGEREERKKLDCGCDE